MTVPIITIDMDAPCKRCRAKGALGSGYCLACLTLYVVNGGKWPPTRTKAKRSVTP
jgi:hypothetical protein